MGRRKGKRVRSSKTVDEEKSKVNGNEVDEDSTQVTDKTEEEGNSQSDIEHDDDKGPGNKVSENPSQHKSSEINGFHSDENIFSDDEKEKDDVGNLVDKALEDLKSDEEQNEENSEPEKPVLRLVPLTKLINPDFLSPKKQSNRRSKSKATSLIELSSDESSEESLEMFGTAKSTKSQKQITVNIKKMPENVKSFNKLYIVNSNLSQIESSSDFDDFEKMISMSKIEKIGKTVHVESSDDEIPLAKKRNTKNPPLNKKKKAKPSIVMEISSDDDDTDTNVTTRNKKAVKKPSRIRGNSSSDDEVVPLAIRELSIEKKSSDESADKQSLILDNKMRSRREKFVDNHVFNELKSRIDKRKMNKKESEVETKLKVKRTKIPPENLAIFHQIYHLTTKLDFNGKFLLFFVGKFLKT